MEQISHKITAKEFTALSQNMQRDLNAVFSVRLDEVIEILNKVKLGEMSLDEFLLYIDAL